MRLDRENLAAWFGEVTTVPPPPDLIVEREAADLLERTLVDLQATPSFDERDPGCYLFFLARQASQGRDERLDLAGIAERINGAARAAHRVLPVRWDTVTEQSDRLSWPAPEPADRSESYIVLADQRVVPSIGPGGRVVLEERDGTVLGSAAVRPFRESRRARAWVSLQAVDEELAPFFDRALECSAEFGYYEASWMERQAVIQPTFVFVIETDGSAEYPLKWLVTLPATTGVGGGLTQNG